MKQLSDFIKSKVVISADELENILSNFQEMMLEKGQFILKTGQIANHYYFIKKGALRFYYGDYEEQLTAWVIVKDEFFTEISSLNPQLPTRFNIEAIEKTELFCIHRDDMEILYKQIPTWQEFGRITWENMAIRMINQIISFQTLSAEERYLEFMRDTELMKRVPVKQIASYLGITPNALSRIRKNIK
ncbi:Crp/Fnr family transcriptional regulator [Flavobacterium geliluteum]|uniref:Crp/Fnr family transcriptional regulator n=1 Tax=Flavobacterium geliluteum TaxID=2816120 RepID=A0A941AW35_9FLAO|nr:Crp/Fnr family transcriptional regulator [Flavobacterium geliluteum]MBP4137080.1 Crp/Fnr family transcriptional regulator [Flavobacterium geliluteum]